MKCNKCKSSNVQRYQVIHEQGTSNINLGSNTVGGGVGFGGGLRGGVGLGRTGTSGKSQTIIAEKTQPPKDLRFVPVVPLLVIGLLFYAFDNSSFRYIFLIYCILAFILFIFFVVRASEVLEKNNNEWLNTWYCNKCGNSFISK
jgi:hypothetical protein